MLSCEMARRPKRPWNLALLDEDRRSLGWTHSDIAAESGLSVPTVTRFFRGTFSSPKTAKRIALALGHPVSRYVNRHEVAA